MVEIAKIKPIEQSKNDNKIKSNQYESQTDVYAKKKSMHQDKDIKGKKKFSE